MSTVRYNNAQKAEAAVLLEKVTGHLVSVFTQAEKKGYISMTFKKANGVSGDIVVTVLDQAAMDTASTDGTNINPFRNSGFFKNKKVGHCSYGFWHDNQEIQLDVIEMPWFFGNLLSLKFAHENNQSSLKGRHHTDIGKRAQVQAAIKMGLVEFKR